MDRIRDVPDLNGWIPIRFDWNAGPPIVEWCYLGPERFSEPFFNQTVDNCLRLPFNLLFRHETQMAALHRLRMVSPGLNPSGFIFHMSRCGSTLVGQMLGSLSQSIVISEAPPIDSLIRAAHKNGDITADQSVEWLRDLVSALGQPRLGNEKYYFIKFDAWHILDLPLIRRAFPDVPWIFLFRDPVEVLVSQSAQASPYLLPGAMYSGAPALTRPRDDFSNLAEHYAEVLANLCEAALRYEPDGGTLINYEQLPEAVWSTVLDVFNVSYTAAELEKMKSAASVQAKNPALTFEADSATKQQKASEQIRAAADKFLFPVYHQLETARKLSL